MSQEAANQIVHVLFLDIVGYSTQTTTAQSRSVAELNALVASTQSYTKAQESGAVLPLPTGDGMALIFSDDVTLPARCAVDVWKRLSGSDLGVRMGLHSGLVQRNQDIAGKENVAGEGINIAQRVMDLGDAGHILVSGQYAAWLRQFDEWAPHLHDLGDGIAKHGVTIAVSNLYSPEFGLAARPGRIPDAQALAPGAKRLVLLYKRKAQPDEQLLEALEAGLSGMGHVAFVDRHLKIGVEWAKAIEEKIRSADAVVALISDSSIGSEMLEYELETAQDENRKRGKPFLLPVRIGSEKAIEGTIGGLVNALNYCVWKQQADTARVLSEIASALKDPPKPNEERQLEPVGGAMSPDSPFYIERITDAEFINAIKAKESIVLVKGPRQMGKTSLIGRGAKWTKENDRRVAMTDFQKLGNAQLQSDEAFYRVLAATLARQLQFTYDFATEWVDVFGANMNLDNFLRSALEASDKPLVWFMDEADKLFGVQFSSDFFGLVRSWHNSRATEPDGPWSRFTVVIGYATEAHLFIQDLNQSPFNVGRQIRLAAFTVSETADLNVRYGNPLSGQNEVQKLHELVGGQPFLTRRALDVLTRQQMDLATLMDTSDRDEGPFGDHLKRILVAVSQLPSVLEAVRSSATYATVKDSEGYHRLLAAGVVEHTTDGTVKFSSELYRRYLSAHIG